MKRFTFIPIALAALLTLSCQKNVPNTDPAPEEIILTVNADELGTDVSTKTTAVSSLPASLYWGATTGSGSEATKWASASGTVSAGKISTGKYQTATPTTYNYYLSNVSMSIGANTTVSATGGTSGTDVICGRTSSSNTAPTVTMNHVFARTGSITTTCVNGSLTSLSYTIKTKGANTGTSGTYNLRTGAWSGVSGLSSATAITGSSDMYLIPGDYTIAATGTYTRGDYVVTKTLTGTVTLTGGKINNIALTWPDGGTEIQITVTLTGWSTEAIASNVQEPLASFGGLNIAPGNLMWNGSTFVIENDWNRESFDEVYGLNNGSYYFSFIDLGKYFDSRGNSFSVTSGDIDNNGNKVSWGGYNDWRLPTYTEWCTIITGDSPGTSRAGSTVNGVSGARYAIIKLEGIPSFCYWTTLTGLLLFPDNKVITGKSLDGVNAGYCTWHVTSSELQVYLSQGCAFLPAATYCYDTFWEGADDGGYYLTSTEYYDVDFPEDHDEDSGFFLNFFTSSVNLYYYDDKTDMYVPARLVRSI